MKATARLAGILLALPFLFTNCNSEDQAAKESVKDLRSYVDSVNSVEPKGDNWNTIEMKYNEKADRAEVATSKPEVDEKLKADYEQIKADYAALKEKYQKQQAVMYKKALRDALFGEGSIGQDITFNYVNAANAANVYERFVNSVAANKDNYSREDWDEVKVLYEALDTRKNEIEKDLAGKDNRKIAGLKIRFASIKAVNRPGAKQKKTPQLNRTDNNSHSNILLLNRKPGREFLCRAFLCLIGA
ncbi:MAG: DUF6565 domain-containing protein [Bacteroidota bacterium]